MQPPEDPLEMVARHVREQAERIRKQIQLVKLLAQAGAVVDREEQILRNMYKAFEQMRGHLSDLQRDRGKEAKLKP